MRGRVVDASAAGVVIELDSGRRAVVRGDDLPPAMQREPAGLVGAEIEGLVVAMDRDHGGMLVSARHLGIQRCASIAGTRRRVRGRVLRANRAGLQLDVSGLTGFLPLWELPAGDALALERFVGTTRRVYVIGMTRTHALLSAFSPRARRRSASRRQRRLSSASARASNSDDETASASESLRIAW